MVKQTLKWNSKIDADLDAKADANLVAKVDAKVVNISARIKNQNAEADKQYTTK